MDSKVQISQAAGAVGGMTLISRIFGFLRDTIIAMVFGSSMAADAFFVAFRLPNMQRRLLGEGAVSAAFIPVFAETLEQKGKEEGWALANSLLNILCLLLLILVAGMMVFAPWIIMGFAPGFLDQPDKYDLTVDLTRWMAPYLLFIGLAALLMGILNTFKVFAIPASAPILLNISMIVSVLFLSPQLEEPIWGLAVGVLIGGAVQFLIQVPAVIKKGYVWKPQMQWKRPEIVRIGRLMIPVILGLAVYEINILVDTILASLLPGGSISYLYYGNRLVQLPLGVFGVALGVAILPLLSEQAAHKDFQKLTSTLAFGIRLILFVTIPATVGLAVLRFPIVNTLWERGEFTLLSTQGTATALLFYSVGLCAFAGIKVIAPAFYSLQDTRTPAKIAAYSLVLNIILNLILMGPLGHGGLALATSLSAIFNVGCLIYCIRKKLGLMGGRKIAVSSAKLAASSFFMGITVFAINDAFFDPSANLSYKILVLFGEISLGVGVFLTSSRLFKNQELDFIAGLIRSDNRSHARRNIPE